MKGVERAPYCGVMHGQRRCDQRAAGVVLVGSRASNACLADGAAVAVARGGRFTPVPRWISANTSHA